MNSGKSSSTEPAVDPSKEFDVDLDIWIKSYCDNVLREPVTNSGANVDDTAINPNYPSQPLMPIVEAGTNFGGGSSNVTQFGITQQMMTSSSLTTGSSSTDTLHGSGQILSSAIRTLSSHVAQSSQSHRSDFHHYQPLQPIHTHQTHSFTNQSNIKAVLQPQTPSFTSQSNFTFDDQMGKLHYQTPSNQLLPYTGPIVNIQTGNPHSNQTPRVQMQQQYLSQNQLQLQQVTGISGDLVSVGGQQQGSNTQTHISAPVGFLSPSEFSLSSAYREYAFRQIRKMKERYYSELLKMHSNAKQLHIQATTVDDSAKFRSIITYLEKMMRFLNISTVDMVPKNDQMVYNYMNVVVNYMAYNMKDKPGGSSQHCEPVHQSPKGSSVQLLNPYQRATNLETNMVNFNQNFTSIRPQPEQSRMPSNELNNRYFPKQQINSGPNTSIVIGSGSPISLLSNTTATNLPFSPLNHQPSVVNQNFNSEKMKQPMHKPIEFPKPKPRTGMSPLGSRLVNHYPPHQLSPGSSVNPVSQQTSVPSSRFDVNSLLSPQSIARSPFLLSSNSSTSSSMSSLTTVETQKHTAPMGTPCQEPQTSKDAIRHLTQVVKSISSKALSSSLTDISTMEKAADNIPDCIPTNLVGQYKDNNINNERRPKMRREISVTSTLNNQFDPPEWDIETSFNKKPKIENKWALLEEIKEINSKLLETTIHGVLDPSEENITILGGHEGIILKCLFRNVCFPDLLAPHGSISSEKMPEFGILLLVPFNYPASSTRIFKSGQNVLKCEPWGKLYEEMLTRFNLSTRGVRGILSVGELARKWDASAHAVMTEFMRKLGGQNFSLRYGNWESCINSSSGSN